jgi:multiple sugar transport system substrate-binding protein
MKRKVSILLAALLSVSIIFGGCSSGSSSSSQAQSGNKQSGNLTMWIPGQITDDSKDAYTQVIKNFNKTYPNVTVDFTIIPWAQYNTKLNTALAGGTAPDVMGTGFGMLGPLVTNGSILQLDSYLNNWDGLTDISKNVFDAGKSEGKLYAILMPEVRLLVYRTDLFKKAGLDPSKPPKTLDEIKTYAQKLVQKQNGKVTVDGFTTPSASDEQYLVEFAMVNGATQLWDEDNKINVTSDAYVKALTWLNTFIKEDLSAYSDFSSSNGTQIANGLSAMQIDTSADLVQCLKNYPGQIGVALPPNDEVLMMGTFMAVNSKTKKPELATALLKETQSKDSQMAVYKGVGFMPSRASLKDQYIKLNPDINNVVFQAMQKGKSYGNFKNANFNTLINVIMRPELEATYYGKTTPDQALKNIQTKYDALK